MEKVEEIAADSLIPVGASTANTFRVEFTGKLRSVLVSNDEDSGGKLMIGLNTEELVRAIHPGQSVPISCTKESAYLRGFLVLAWEDGLAVTEKIGTITRIKVGELITDC